MSAAGAGVRGAAGSGVRAARLFLALALASAAVIAVLLIFGKRVPSTEAPPAS